MAIHLLEALRHIRTHGPKYTYHGICVNTAELCNCHTTTEPQLDVLIATWPCALNDKYPIEGSLVDYAADHNKWQNPRRIALLDWLIAQLELEQHHHED